MNPSNPNNPKKYERYRFVDVNEIDTLELHFKKGFVLFERAVYHPAHQTFYQTLVKYEPEVIRQPLYLTSREKECLHYLQNKDKYSYKHLARYMSCSTENVKDILKKLRHKLGANRTGDIVRRLQLYNLQP